MLRVSLRLYPANGCYDVAQGEETDCVTDGEFHVDLYTLPDPLIKMLWDFCDKKVDMSAMA